MPNRNYEKGRRFERKLVNDARGVGLLSARTAGSKSIFDVIIINPKTKYMTIIQAKTGKYASRASKSLKKAFEKMSGGYTVKFKVLTDKEVRESGKTRV